MENLFDTNTIAVQSMTFSQSLPGLSRSLTQKEWMKVILKCLLYLHRFEPPPESKMYKEDRQVIPGPLMTPVSPCQYCYAYKGVFLPSGNLDGRVWKPSQGARPAGDGLMKRYFYYKENNTKIKRQVIWLAANDNWCFLDYRFNVKGKILVENIQLPQGFDFEELLVQADSKVSIPMAVSEKKRKVAPCMRLLPPPLPEGDLLTLDVSFEKAFDIMPSQAGWDSILDGDTAFHMDQFDLLPSLDDSVLGHVIKESEDSYQIAKRQKTMVITAPPAATSSTFFSFSPFDYLFNHLLSYDQILDYVCQNICTQLIFNRRCFQVTGMDPNSLLQLVVQRSSLMNVDLKEFPGQLVTNFFSWLYECFNKSLATIPTIYCIVCGKSGEHDEHVHSKFYSSLDQGFVVVLKEKAKNLFDLVKELLGFLLRSPNSRQTFQEFVQANFHCPFCAGKNGEHCHDRHDQWAEVLSLETEGAVEVKEPEPTDNLDKYTNSTFEYLMGRMPYHIPTFLLGLSNVQSFLDCLVEIWRSIRLI